MRLEVKLCFMSGFILFLRFVAITMSSARVQRGERIGSDGDRERSDDV